MSPAEPKARLMKSTPMAGLYSVGSQTRKLDLILGELRMVMRCCGSRDFLVVVLLNGLQSGTNVR